jgi:hypothetical protein
MTVSDEDLALVSAFHDGELEPSDTARLRARLCAEPELEAELAGIREISTALKALRPMHAHVRRPIGRRTMRRNVGVGIAACLVGALTLGTLAVSQFRPSGESALDWHRHFLAQPYGASGQLDPAPIARWIDREPDLTSADLTLVDIAQDKQGSVFLHYSGINGCRLTFGTHDFAPVIPSSEEGLLTDGWPDGDLYYSVFAVGMDRERFQAIAQLLKNETDLDRSGDQLLAAVRDATRRAVPCA